MHTTFASKPENESAIVTQAVLKQRRQKLLTDIKKTLQELRTRKRPEKEKGSLPSISDIKPTIIYDAETIQKMDVLAVFENLVSLQASVEAIPEYIREAKLIPLEKYFKALQDRFNALPSVEYTLPKRK